ncbi:MAG: CocE/NonD family hydrolase, partial [Actinomycetota bacterium]|nr:CocE/NonD family hydrolase [Actinomycetota bacterium]
PQRAGGPSRTAGGVFDPTPASQPLYGTQAPSVDPATQRVYVEAHDGVDLFVETWLPAAKDGNVPPEKVPTILIMTPYVRQGTVRYPAVGPGGRVAPFIEYFTARGYAVSQHHVRGTGESGGCLEQTGPNQIDDGARVVEFLGRDAPWSDGNVAMYGRSYDGETQLSVAGLGDPRRTKYLDAIVPIASVAGQYEWNFMDGVPYTAFAATGNAGYALTSASPGARLSAQQYAEKTLCQPEVMANSANVTGDMTPWWRAREYRSGAPNIRAATLYVHGLADRNVQPIGIAGMFDLIPETTPHVGVFGQWEHANPNHHPGVEPDWAREDWFPMVTAWFDRYLKGIDTGVDDWPSVQVQDTTGAWRVEPEFPTTGGPVGHLALGPGGTLGASVDPSGTTTYTEGVDDGTPISGDRAVFETAPLSAPLHLTGQPALDLSLQTNVPDGHVATKLQVIGPDGQILRQAGSGRQEIGTYGMRSLQHLDPMPHNHFEQEQGKLAPMNTPIPVLVRFQPTDFVVPAGARLRLTIAGTITYASRDTQPSGSRATITILHDCERPSALRFLMPTPGADLIDVREWGETSLESPGATQSLRDGGGTATAPVCGEAPQRLEMFGPESDAGSGLPGQADPRAPGGRP